MQATIRHRDGKTSQVERKLTTTEFTCHTCGENIIHTDTLTTGYGCDKDDNKVCFSCCGKEDARVMATDGKITLYLTHDELISYGRGAVSNWPGTLIIPCTVRKGRHNIARTRYDVWFTGPDGSQWHGVQYGENTQICHCRKLRK